MKNYLMAGLIIPVLLLCVFSCQESETAENGAPGAPSSLVADALTGATIKLTWTDNADDEEGFTLQRSTNAEFTSETEIDIPADATSHVDMSLDDGQTWYYRILSYNGNLLSEWSNTAQEGLPVATTIPDPPSVLNGASTGSTSITLYWIDNSDNETHFTLERSLDIGFALVDTFNISDNTETYTDSGCAGNTTYYYRLAAVNGIGTSAYSNMVTITTPEAPDDTVIRVSFTDGTEHGGGDKIYTIWLTNAALNADLDANEDEYFFQNIFVCNRVNYQNLTGTALPYWEDNIREFFTPTEIDAISGATIKTGDFSQSVVLADNSIREFTVYFEVDHSWDDNDWFSDQPAVLYSVEIDLDNPQPSYEMEFIGWTPNENTDGGTPGGEFGKLNEVLEYILNLNDGSGGFGVSEPEPATDQVGGLLVEINP